jgi:hypothetical protein
LLLEPAKERVNRLVSAQSVAFHQLLHAVLRGPEEGHLTWW